MRPRYDDHPEHLRQIREAVLRAADPYEAVRAACERRAAREPGLRHAGFVAIGKAAARMRDALLTVTPNIRGVTVVPDGVDAGKDAVVADHPLPTERSIVAGEAVRSFVRGCAGAEERRAAERSGGDAAVLTLLLSGGASSLVCLPAEGVALEDLRSATRALMRAGATIDELNTVRRHAERLKGGRLAALAAPCRVDVLALSDVIGDNPAAIGSGPAAPDPTTFADALAVLERRRALQAGPTLTAHLRAGARGEHPDTLKPDDAAFDRVRMRIIASNTTALHAAREAVESLGFRIAAIRPGVTGDAANAGSSLVRAAIDRHPRERPLAVLYGGETTVDVGDARGIGGRNQEAALAAALAIDAAAVAVMTFSTDGVDGPTDAAGAVVNSHTRERALAMGLDPFAALRGHDSTTLLDHVGALIRTGPTGTNVNDIMVALAY